MLPRGPAGPTGSPVRRPAGAAWLPRPACLRVSAGGRRLRAGRRRWAAGPADPDALCRPHGPRGTAGAVWLPRPACLPVPVGGGCLRAGSGRLGLAVPLSPMRCAGPRPEGSGLLARRGCRVPLACGCRPGVGACVRGGGGLGCGSCCWGVRVRCGCRAPLACGCGRGAVFAREGAAAGAEGRRDGATARHTPVCRAVSRCRGGRPVRTGRPVRRVPACGAPSGPGSGGP